MQKIATCLTFSHQAEEAVNFYLSVFKNSRILSTMRVGENGTGEGGQFLSATFEIEGQEFIALNGGESFSFAPGISLFVKCPTQEEIDELYGRLSEGGEQQPCGWLRDKFGVSWQIVPPVLGELLQDRNPQKARKVFEAMCTMKKLDIQALQKAHEEG